MRFSLSIVSLVTLLPAVLSAPAELKPVTTVNGPKKVGSYIVTLKSGSSPKAAAAQAKGPTQIYENFNSYVAELDEEGLNQTRADPDVEAIEEDGIATISAKQTDAPWGLARVSQRKKVSGDPAALNFEYRYDDHSCGEGVDVYIVDTGINTEHVQFEGRARWGKTFGPYADHDGNGHGTHCAGTVGSKQFGVAKSANLIAVKVLGDSGSGSYSDVIGGLNWVLEQAKATRRPSVVSMSLSGPASNATDNAVAALTKNGVHVVVAAGNNAKDASDVSPARAPSAITVAASDINDSFASFSNYGKAVDIIAPGVSVISTYIGSNTATARLSGTSMATPHVAGIVARFISESFNLSPSFMSEFLASTGVRNTITGVPEGTVNKLAQVW